MAKKSPRRGGEHPTYGIFIGGSFLDNEYKLTGTRHYQFTSQRRSANVVNSIEQALLTTIESKSAPKLKANTTYCQQRQTSSGKRRRSNKNNKVGSSASLTTLSTKQPMFAVTVGNGLVNAKIVDLNLSTGFPAKERG